MKLKDKKVLVTGATGFIGSHLVQKLLSEGAEVRAMSHYRADPSLHNLEYLSEEEMSRVEVLRGNIEDTFFVRTAVKDCDIVFHLAALIGIPYSYIAPQSYVATNIQGTLNVLEACRAEGTPRMVHTSTSECYGTALYAPIDEKHPMQGQSPYSATKIGADKIAESYYRSFDLPVVTLRPFNTYGPRQSARAVIPTIAQQAVAGFDEISLGNLDAQRDLVFVKDTANAFFLAGTTPGIEGEVIHFGTGVAVTIGELAEKILKIAESDAKVVVDQSRIRPAKSEVELLLCNPAKAKELMGWEATVTLDEGLKEVVDFVRQHVDKINAKSYNV